MRSKFAFNSIEDGSGDLIDVMGTQNACDVAPILLARFSYGVSGARDHRPAPRSPPRPGGPRRPIPASTEASADPAGGDLVVLADGRRLLACGAFGAAGYIDVDL